MELFGSDLIFGSLRLSDYGMALASFSCDGTSEDSLGVARQTIEEYLGGNPIPVYLGETYTEKLKPQITIVKNPDTHSGGSMYFDEKEYRSIFRLLNGVRGYQWMKVINDREEVNLWYLAKISDISVKKVNGRAAGIILSMECDSCFGWSDEIRINLHFTAERIQKLFTDTDDLNSYLYPAVTVIPKSSGTFRLTNTADRHTTELKNVTAGEIITIDSGHEIISSAVSHPLLLNDFNLNWPRLLPGENRFQTNMTAEVAFSYRAPRKAVLL